MTKEERDKINRPKWELIKTLMPELAKEMIKHPGFFKTVTIKEQKHD